MLKLTSAATFGNFLIRQVVEELRRDMPSDGLRDPVAGAAFRSVAAIPVRRHRHRGRGGAPDRSPRGLAPRSGRARTRLDQLLPVLAAPYLVLGRDGRDRILDPVARFHIGNGASLARINAFGDLSFRAIDGALGLMVNYRYRLEDVERNHERFLTGGGVTAAPAVQNLLNRRQPGFAVALRKRPDAMA